MIGTGSRSGRKRARAARGAGSALAAAIGAAAFAAPAPSSPAQASVAPQDRFGAPREYRIAPGTLGGALNEIADQNNVHVLYSAEATRGRRTSGLVGAYSLTDALDRLLAGTSLTYRFDENGRSLSIVLAQNDATRRDDADATPLPPIDIGAKREPVDGLSRQEQSVVTEGSGSYTSPAVTVAGKTPIARKDVPQSVSVVTRQQMDDQRLVTMTDAMTQAIGVSVISNNASNSQFSARGYALEFMKDGVPSSNGLAGFYQFDLDLYDRVEVLRGPAGLLVGSGNPAGVVNVVKKRPRDEFAATAEFSGGSFDNYLGKLDVTGPMNAERTLRYRAVVSHGERDFYYDRAHESRWLGYGALEYDISADTLANVSYAHQTYRGPSFMGLPNYSIGAKQNGPFIDLPRSTNPYPSWNRHLWDTQEVSARLEHRLAQDWIAKVVFTQRGQTFDYFDAYPTTGADPVKLTATYARRHFLYSYVRTGVDAYVSGSIDLFERTHKVMLGYNVDRYSQAYKGVNFSNVANVPILAPDVLAQPVGAFAMAQQSQTLQHGAYGQLRFEPFDPLSLVVGGRLTNYFAKTRNVAPSAQTAWRDGAKANHRLTPYAAALVKITDEINIYGSYTDIFTPQSQLRSGGGTLDPRVGGQYEAGVKGEFYGGRLNASAAWFDIHDKNRAYADDSNPGYYLQAGEVRSHGVETEVSGRIIDNLEAIAGYTWLKDVYVVDKSNPGRPFNAWSPEHLFKLWTKYSFVGGALDGLSLGGGVVAQSQITGAVNTWNEMRRQAPYAIVNAMLAYKIDDHLTLSLNVDNLFDVQYYSRVGGPNAYNFFGEPRSFVATLRGSL